LERFINYRTYNDYRNYNMDITTIAVTNEIKEKIRELGNKGETYSDILVRLVESAKKRQLHDLLMDEEDTVTAKEALDEAKRRWQK